jgi:hypothetical protein
MANQFDAKARPVQDGSLGERLRKASWVAHESGARELEQWLQLELGGYLASNSAMRKDVVVPEYRTVVGQHADLYGRVLVVPAKLSFVNETRLRNGIEELEALAASRDIVAIHDPNMCDLIQKHLKVEVYSFRFSAIHLKGVLSAIRTEFESRLRKINSPQRPKDSSAQGSQEILILRPNLHGLGIDLRALWKRMSGSK